MWFSPKVDRRRMEEDELVLCDRYQLPLLGGNNLRIQPSAKSGMKEERVSAIIVQFGRDWYETRSTSPIT